MDEDRTLIITQTGRPDGASPDRIHCLECIDGVDVGRRHVIPETGLVVGRVPPADVIIGDSEVSRRHCRIFRRGEEVWVEDLGSTNGTYVDGRRIDRPVALAVGALLQTGRSSFKHEWLTGGQLARTEALDRDLAQAFAYVQALLPAPQREGPIQTDWLFQPCAQLGGDAFGYGALGEDKYYGFLMDVSGHGAGAALHSVAVMNVLRQAALPQTDMQDPAQVLTALNAMFDMERHANLYFSIWYGVFDARTRTLDFASGGHHPAYLQASSENGLTPLRTANPLIGFLGPDARFKADRVTLPPDARIYVFSDGLFEFVDPAGRQWDLDDVLPIIAAPSDPGVTESERIFRAVRGHASPGELDDDITLMVMRFA
jgi:Stage II sporulation protein E (SpoIIE)/FHA domain